MASSHSAVRKALRGLEDGLTLFTSQLALEASELRRNVESQPRTGATYYRNILEDVQQRAEGVGQELEALEAVSTEAVSLEELVGHSVALYCQNHRQIQELETRLAQFGYRDLFAPLPPESPLDMLELSGGGGTGRLGADGAGSEELAEEGDDLNGVADYAECAEHDAGPDGDLALGEVTNRLAAAHLAAPASADCEDASPLGAGRAGGAAPRTTIKAMAPMTAAKARLLREDTPSSLASPEALSPSMRELLGRYAASSSGGTHVHGSGGGLPTVPGSVGGATPMRGAGAGSTPPVPAYLSPAFQLAAMEQEVQMAHADAAAAVAAGAAGATPEGNVVHASWQADDALYSALTATARKLAGKPSFMEAYRQKFPAIVASTERLLQTVEKQRRPAAAAAVAQEEADAGPVAALAMAAQAAAGHDVGRRGAGEAAAEAQRQQEQQAQAERRRSVDEESTLDLMAQVLHSRPAGQRAAEHRGAPAMSARYGGSAASPPRAGNAASQHATSSLRPEQAPAAQPVLQSAPRSERSKPQLEEAIAAALRRGPTSAAAPAPTGATPAPTPAHSSAPFSSSDPAVAPSARGLAGAPPAAPPTTARQPVACPPPPPAALAPTAMAGEATPAAAAGGVPPLRCVGEDEYGALPTFIRSGLPLGTLNDALAAVHAMAQERGVNGFTMEDVQAAGLGGAKHKVVVNSLVKLGRVQLHVARGGLGTTLYLLV